MVVKTNDLVLRAARRERTERTPVWLMRQAGRFDPAYRDLRERCRLPLEEMFRTPDLAAEISLLPRRLSVDAIIIFQDILTPLAPIGAPFVFRPGPVLERPIRTAGDVARLRDLEPGGDLPFVVELIEMVRRDLDGDLPLLGFAGAPLTLAAFLIEGGSPGGMEHLRLIMANEPSVLHDLLERLARMTAAYLEMQIGAGVDAVQLFESIAEALTEQEYVEFAHPYQALVLDKLSGTVPRILFAKEHPNLELMVKAGADVLSIGAGADLRAARERHGSRVALQGNVDNRLLAEGSPAEITAAVEACVRAGAHEGHILNLNHGLLPDTPFDNVRRLIDACQAYRLDDEPAQTTGDDQW